MTRMTRMTRIKTDHLFFVEPLRPTDQQIIPAGLSVHPQSIADMKTRPADFYSIAGICSEKKSIRFNS
jgi:hypothetical protein